MATICRANFALRSLARRALICRLYSNGSPAQEGPIGFIGLGNMGSPMAKNLLGAGQEIIVHDVARETVVDLKTLGAATAAAPSEVASKTSTIFTMLPSSPNVRDVYCGENGILSTIKPGSLLIDTSTIEPAVAKEIGELVQSIGATFLDAPVSGGVIAAKGGTLTFMVGGEEEAYERASKILQHMGKNVIHTGAIGTGQTAKICNNLLLAVSMIGVSEATNLGIRLGLEPEMIAKVINTSSGRCWSSDTYNPCPGIIEGIPSSNNYQGGFASQLMVKDLGLAQSAATSTKTPTPMGSLAHQIYRIMCNKGYGTLDYSSVFQFLKENKH
ncbi:3-hydroxyisobutyrate dehydrogenase, mitochondrial-like [Oculina patagonica]